MNPLALLLVAAMAIHDGAPPAPPPLSFNAPSGALPWPVPDFGFASAPVTFDSVTLSHSTTYTDTYDSIQTNVDNVTSPITDLSSTIDSMLADMPDPSDGLAGVMMADPLTGDTVSAQTVVTDSAERISMPIAYGRASIQFMGYLSSQFPSIGNIGIFLAALLLNSFVHLVVLFIRFIIDALAAFLGFVDKFLNLVAEIIP